MKRGRKGPYGKPDYKRKRYAQYRAPRPIFPQEYVTTLRYTVGRQVNTAGGTQQLAGQWRNAPYDVDPTLANTAMPGFGEFATLFARCRCLRMGYKITFVNKEAFPVMCTVFMNQQQMVTAAGYYYGATGNPLTKSVIVGNFTGPSKAVLKANHSIVEMAGTKQALYDDLYTSSTTSNTLSTAGTCWINVFVETLDLFTAQGVEIFVEVNLTVQFYRSLFLAV